MGRPVFYNDGFYHIFNKSIANFEIFKSKQDNERFLNVIDYYNSSTAKKSYSNYLSIHKKYEFENLLVPRKNKLIKFISYCIMPSHYHFLVKVQQDKLIYKYLNNIEEAYTRYLNLKIKRKGPLWESAYIMKPIQNNKQLLHVSRYIHLNPVTAGLVTKPELWKFSSYNLYISNSSVLNIYLPEISIRRCSTYKKFVENNKDYQIKLNNIKKLLVK